MGKEIGKGLSTISRCCVVSIPSTLVFRKCCPDIEPVVSMWLVVGAGGQIARGMQGVEGGAIRCNNHHSIPLVKKGLTCICTVNLMLQRF